MFGEQQLLFEESEETTYAIDAKVESNIRLRIKIEETLIGLGYQPTEQAQPAKGTFLKDAPYTDMFNASRRAAFLIHHKRLGLARIEAHRQQQSGSVDQKFPFFFQSLLNAEEPHLLIILDGNGYKQEAYQWLTTAAEQEPSHRIEILAGINEFTAWLSQT